MIENNRIKSFFLFDSAIRDELKNVKPRIMEDNRRFAVIWSVAQILYWSYCLVMSVFLEAYTRCRYAYLVALILSVLAWIFSAFLVKKVPKLIYPTMALVKAALITGGLLIAWILLRDDSMTITIFASVLIFPMFFINNTLTNIVTALIEIIAAFLLLRHGLSEETFRWTVTNLILFSSIGIAFAHFINRARFERYVFAESAVQLAESNAKLAELQTKIAYYDQLSGLRNRRKFSEIEEEYKNNLPNYCCVIMVDINELKLMNDTRGHDAGDELIVGTANCLRRCFKGIGTIYRIGGDEFCVILKDPEVDVDRCLSRLDRLCAEWRGKFVKGFSVSCGYASSEEFSNIATIIMTADQRMYTHKRNYYSEKEKDNKKPHLI